MTDEASPIRILIAKASPSDDVPDGLRAARTASQRSLLRRFKWRGGVIAAPLVIGLILALLVPDRVHALDPNKKLTQYIHHSWRIQDGSAPAGMYTMAQTSDGFLWFLSSRGGIYRFDGTQFRPWHLPGDVSSIGKFTNIIGDHTGGLWVLGANGIAYLKDGTLISHFDLGGVMPDAGALSLDSDDSLWLVRGENGVSEPLCHVTQRSFKCFGKSNGIPIAPIDAIAPDGSGGFWLGGQDTLVHWHTIASEVYPIKGLKSNTGEPGIMSLARGPDGSVWIGMGAGPGQGLARLQNGSVTSFVTPAFDGAKIGTFALRFDCDGNLWVGTNNDGVFRVHEGTVDHYTRTEGLSGDFVRAMFEDRERIVWSVGSNGIDSFHDPRITTFSSAEGLGRDWAVGVLASKDDTIWVANANSLDHIDNRGAISSIRTGNGLPGSQVSSLLEDHSGNLWVGVDDELYIYKNGDFRRLPERNGRPFGMVFDLIEDVDGNVWAECATGELVRIRDFRVQEEFSRAQVQTGRLSPDPRGGIWIGARNGDFLLFRDGVLKKFPVGSKANPWTNEILVQADGSVLAAFDDGLVGLRDGQVHRMTVQNGLPCEGIISFIKDKGQNWWLNTQCGIVELSNSELQRWLAAPEAVISVHLYDALDGARPSSRPPFHAAAASPDGRVWFVNSGVVQMLNPSGSARRALPAQTYIESITVDRKEYAASKGLRVAPHPRDLQIDYTSPTFLIPQKVKFRYRLDGYDRDWHEASTRRQAFYTDLPPAKYSFRVIAANSEGVWNDNAATLNFSVAPAYYQTNSFRVLCATFLVALLWAAHKWRTRQLRQQFALTLDTRVAERTRIARDLHDTLLQSFHGILLFLQSGIHLLDEHPAQAKKTLETAAEQAERAIIEGREAVYGLRASTVERNDLALAIKTLGGELAAADGNAQRAEFAVQVEGIPRNLHPILRDEVYRIAGEAMRNAFRHADAKQIEVEIRYDERQLRLRVRDDGKGIDPKVLSDHAREGHYGLPGMRERAKLIGGKLTVWSELDSGTEVELSIPASRAYTVADGQRSWLAETFAKLSGKDTELKS